jgi:hypothetical protein
MKISTKILLSVLLIILFGLGVWISGMPLERGSQAVGIYIAAFCVSALPWCWCSLDNE